MGLSVVQIREKLRAKIAAQMAATANKNNAGMARDYAQYRENVGRIAGGAEAMSAVDEVFKTLMEEDE